MHRPLASTVLPSLRVVALVYTGLSAIAGFVLLVGAALAPKAPTLQQVTEPAREAVTTMVEPTTDLVSGFVPPVAPVLVAAPTAAPTLPPFVDTTKLNVIIDIPPTPVVLVREVPRVIYVAPTPVIEDQPQEATPAGDEVVLAAPTDAPAMHEASAQAPSPLPTSTPTVVIPTTPEQVKAQVDAANQAAIDAAKAQATQQKTAADTANQAAIDARKRANAPTLADSALALPTPTARHSADAAKLAAEKAKVEADAANQAAINAARALKYKR